MKKIKEMIREIGDELEYWCSVANRKLVQYEQGLVEEEAFLEAQECADGLAEELEAAFEAYDLEEENSIDVDLKEEDEWVYRDGPEWGGPWEV